MSGLCQKQTSREGAKFDIVRRNQGDLRGGNYGEVGLHMLFASSQVKDVNKSIFAGFVALTLVSTITCADAQQLGTPEEARAMLDRAISALKTNEDKALTEFNDPDNKQFHD